MKHMNGLFLLLILAVITLPACNKDDDPKTVTERSTTIKVNFSSKSPYTFFSFKNNAVVANTDSASAKWDIGIRLTTILVNSNASGPGNAAALMQDGIFDTLVTAPASGYAVDTTATRLAIKDASWYSYSDITHSFVPKAGKVFFFRTADNKYAKMEILEATYDPFTGLTPEKINYKIRFVYQEDGSTNLSKM